MDDSSKIQTLKNLKKLRYVIKKHTYNIRIQKVLEIKLEKDTLGG